MKKIALAAALFFTIALGTNINLVKATSYTDILGVNYNPAQRDVFKYIWDGTTAASLCQSFVATSPTLANYVDLLAYGNAEAAAYRVTLYENAIGFLGDKPGPIYNGPNDESPDNGFFAASEMGVMPTGPNSLQMTRFYNLTGNQIEVTNGDKYWICVYADLNYSSSMMAIYGDLVGTYRDGLAGTFPEGEPLDQIDFGFATYNRVANPDPTPTPTPTANPTTSSQPTATASSQSGATPTPATSAAQATSTPLPAGVTAGSGAAPAAPTTSIKQPTELTVADVPADQGGALKLDWKASTTADIDGYKIFRSTEEAANFTEIAKTEKTILTYTDSTATSGQKYYYMVRAYKTTKESVSSNTTNGTSTDNVAPSAPQGFNYFKTSDNLYTFSWSENSEADLSGYALAILDVNKANQVVETINLEKGVNSYTLDFSKHPELDPTTFYNFELVAKDGQANLSTKTMANQVQDVNALVAEPVKESAPEKNNNVWYIVSGVILLIVAGGLIYWFKFRKPKAKIKPLEQTANEETSI